MNRGEREGAGGGGRQRRAQRFQVGHEQAGQGTAVVAAVRLPGGAAVASIAGVGEVPGVDDGAVEEVREHLEQLACVGSGFVRASHCARSTPDLRAGLRQRGQQVAHEEEQRRALAAFLEGWDQVREERDAVVAPLRRQLG
ncbi:hypothetical protein [Streptomyces sp. NPDC059256]|uniref:hypothetical protein n=1 Tax=Streptomyces sp. NPDC059256 TaxID=3346794 RepID=UPI00367A84E8